LELFPPDTSYFRAPASFHIFQEITANCPWY
jgi:hypothetical protein